MRARRSNQEAYGSDMLRKPESLAGVEGKEEGLRREVEGGEEDYVDWEDRILEDTVPLVGFVRMVLHSGKYVFATVFRVFMFLFRIYVIIL